MVWWLGSLSKGKLNLYLALNKACALTESALMPRTATLSFSNFFFASRNSDASMIRPEVLALGKKKSRTRFRLKSLRSEEHTSELQSHSELVCRLLLEKNKSSTSTIRTSTAVRGMPTST